MKRFFVIAAVLLMLPVGALAQGQATPPPATPPPAAPASPAPEMQQAMMAMMQIQMKLQALQQKALTDPALEKERKAFETLVEAKMTKIDPAAAGWIKEMKAFSDAAKELQQKGDQAGLQALSTQARPVMMKLQKLQQQVMGDAEVSTAVKALDTKVKAKMLALDPTVADMEKQLQALSMKMQAARKPQMPAPAPKAPTSAAPASAK